MSLNGLLLLDVKEVFAVNQKALGQVFELYHQIREYAILLLSTI
jgi:hypothetical protein